MRTCGGDLSVEGDLLQVVLKRDTRRAAHRVVRRELSDESLWRRPAGIVEVELVADAQSDLSGADPLGAEVSDGRIRVACFAQHGGEPLG